MPEIVASLRFVLLDEAEDVLPVLLPADERLVGAFPQLVLPLLLCVLQYLLLLDVSDPPPELLLADHSVPVDINLVTQQAETSLRLLWAQTIEIFGLVPEESVMIVFIVPVINIHLMGFV